MEDENDLMSLFDQNQELNFEYDFGNNDESNEELDENNELNDNAIDDESQEEVDSNDEDDESGDDSSESSPNLFSSVADVLFEQGLLPSLDSSENIKSVDDLANVVKKEIEIQASIKIEEYLSNLDLEKVARSKQELTDLNSIDEDYLKDNLEVAKQLIYQDYINQGLSEDRARKLLNKTLDLGEDMLIEEALESRESLKQFNLRLEEQAKLDAQKRLEEEKQEQIKLEQEVKKLVFESKDLIKGLPSTKALKDRVYKSMTEIVSKNPQTGELENKFMKDRNTNPIEFDTRMYYLYELTNGFRDLSNISKQVESKAIKKMEQAMRQTRFEDNGLPNYMVDPNSYDSPFGSELVL